MALDFSQISSLAVLDNEVARLILGRDIQPATRDKLRSRGEWPPCFYVAQRAYVLRSDILEFLERAKQRSEEQRAKRREQSRNAINARWARHRERVGAEETPERRAAP
jgi:hypothetical protein